MTWDDQGGVTDIGVHFVSHDYRQMPVALVEQLHAAGWRLVPDEGQRQVEPRRRRLAGQLLWPAGSEHRLGL